MRMIVAEHLRPARTRPAVGIDQRLRVDLEMQFGLRVNIICGENRCDRITFAQQDAATLQRMRPLRLGKQAGNDIA